MNVDIIVNQKLGDNIMKEKFKRELNVLFKVLPKSLKEYDVSFKIGFQYKGFRFVGNLLIDKQLMIQFGLYTHVTKNLQKKTCWYLVTR